MKNKITNIITWVIIITILIFAFKFYQTNNFNEFVRSEANLRTSEFKRDKETKYSKTASYKITSNNENDAMFSKKVKVEKNTPYIVTCMVKTENVVPENEISSILTRSYFFSGYSRRLSRSILLRTPLILLWRCSIWRSTLFPARRG